MIVLEKCLCSARHDRDINAGKGIAKKAISDALGERDCIKSSSADVPIRVGAAATGLAFRWVIRSHTIYLYGLSFSGGSMSHGLNSLLQWGY